MNFQQQTLPVGAHIAYDASSFFVSHHNQLAHDTLIAHKFQKGACIVWGEASCGKTHLAHIWAERVDGHFLSPQDLDPEHILGRLSCASAFILEDIEGLKNNEESLFHLLNAAKEEGKSLLLTSALPASTLPFSLPDLCSRLRALPSLAITLPDEASMRAFLFKRFADLSIRVETRVISQILVKAPRSYAALNQLVTRLHVCSLQEKKAPTARLLKEILEETPALPS